MQRVGFILKPGKAEAGEILADLVPWLIARGARPVVVDEDHVAPAGAVIVPEAELGEQIDLAVVLGGDGTMLRASSLVADAGRPVLGVNLGRLGFLTAFDPAEAREALQAALGGQLRVSERMRLAARYVSAGGEAVVRTALNDAVIHQGAMARLIEVEASIDGGRVASYRADGLIVSTPTGSTAYNLAAGGPILLPDQDALAITPICAHALTMRPLVFPARSRLSITLGAESRGVVLTVDGQWARSFMPGDRVEITTAERPLRLFESGRSYFDILRAKLHWGLLN